MPPHRLALAALGLGLLLTGSAVAAAPPKSYPTGVFVVAGNAVAAKDVLDARSIPDMQGKPSLMVTLVPASAEALARPAGSAPRLPCTLDGRPIGDSATATLASDHVLQLSGDFGDYDSVAALARRISGRDPVPDAESDE